MAANLKNDVERWRSNLGAERDAQALYLALVRVDKNPRRAQVWQELAEIEQRHADRWIGKLRDAGEKIDDNWRPGWRPRALGLVARVMGPSAVLPIVSALEKGDAEMYVGQPDAQDLIREEEHLGRVIAAILEGREVDATLPDPTVPAPDADLTGLAQPDRLAAAGTTAAAQGAGAAPAELLAGREGWHRGTNASSGALRAAIFGINDGLVSNLSLVMGVAGANPGNNFVLLAGVAGLLAGSCSMAAGEYVSMQSQRELFERQIALERDELEESPEEEERELALIYHAKGVPRVEADRLARTLMRDKNVALDTLVREELGLDPDELGSPWGAAVSSFLAFSVGALIPVLPYLVLGSFMAFLVSAILSGVALFAVGAGVSLLTGRGVLYSGVRMLLIGGAAAAATYLVGKLVGVSVAG
jgi:vacuolar iron transporter family protein